MKEQEQSNFRVSKDRNVNRKRIKGEYCVYCGNKANTDEHFPPASFTSTGFIFPACVRCNRIAGTKYHTNLLERIKYVQSKTKSNFDSVIYLCMIDKDNKLNL